MELSLNNPTAPLEFVLSEHRDAFMAFLLNGNIKPITKDRVERASDLVIGMIADEKGISFNSAQCFINSKTPAGVQNLYVVRFFCEVLN